MITPAMKHLRLAVLAILVVVAAASVCLYRLGRHSFVLITPANYSACLGTGIVAHIQWDFRGAASGKSIFVSAYNLGSQPAVVGSGPLRGELDTGEWVSDGTTFLLTDDQNHVLAKRTVQTTDCAKAPIWPDASSVAIKLVV
jgi:hypothetical protein